LIREVAIVNELIMRCDAGLKECQGSLKSSSEKLEQVKKDLDKCIQKGTESAEHIAELKAAFDREVVRVKAQKAKLDEMTIQLAASAGQINKMSDEKSAEVSKLNEKVTSLEKDVATMTSTIAADKQKIRELEEKIPVASAAPVSVA